MGLFPAPAPVPVAIQIPSKGRLGKRTTALPAVYTPRPEVPGIRIGQRLSVPSHSFGPYGRGIDELSLALSKHGNATQIRIRDELRRRREAV